MIYIIAKYPYLNLGHYWSFDTYIRETLSLIGEEFSFLNEDANRAFSEDSENQNIVIGNNCYVPIQNDQNFIAKCVNYIKLDIESKKYSNYKIFFTWLPQFSENDLRRFDELEDFVNISFYGLTTLTASQIHKGIPSQTRYLHQEYFAEKKTKVLWVSDDLSTQIDPPSYVRQMPDYAKSNISSEKYKKIYDLSFFGLLSPYRGLFEILMISLLNPRLRIRIKGYGYSKRRIFRPWKAKFLRYTSYKEKPLLAIILTFISLLLSQLTKLPNVDFSTDPFETENDLDEALSQTNAVLYCPKLPHGSGITNKSLSVGIPVLWSGWEGQAFKLLDENYPVGKFKFYEIFVPGRIGNKLSQIEPPNPNQMQMYELFVNEIRIIKQIK